MITNPNTNVHDIPLFVNTAKMQLSSCSTVPILINNVGNSFRFIFCRKNDNVISDTVTIPSDWSAGCNSTVRTINPEIFDTNIESGKTSLSVQTTKGESIGETYEFEEIDLSELSHCEKTLPLEVEINRNEVISVNMSWSDGGKKRLSGHGAVQIYVSIFKLLKKKHPHKFATSTCEYFLFYLLHVCYEQHQRQSEII